MESGRVAWISLKKLIEEGWLFGEYNKALFDKVGIQYQTILTKYIED